MSESLELHCLSHLQSTEACWQILHRHDIRCDDFDPVQLKAVAVALLKSEIQAWKLKRMLHEFEAQLEEIAQVSNQVIVRLEGDEIEWPQMPLKPQVYSPKVIWYAWELAKIRESANSALHWSDNGFYSDYEDYLKTGKSDIEEFYNL